MIKLNANYKKENNISSGKKFIRINNEINAKEVRVIDDASKIQLGVMSLQEALNKAESLKVDLVEISSTSTPPVCKLIDFGKYKYQEQKRAHELKMKQKHVQVKEIKLRPVTDEHDYQVKLKNAKRFLSEGNKVKFIVQFRGREMMYQDLGMQYLSKVEEDLKDIVTIDSPAKIEGRYAVMVVSPIKHH